MPGGFDFFNSDLIRFYFWRGKLPLARAGRYNELKASQSLGGNHGKAT